jgi:hypothetical protein
MLQCIQPVCLSLLGGIGAMREKKEPFPEFGLQSTQLAVCIFRHQRSNALTI